MNDDVEQDVVNWLELGMMSMVLFMAQQQDDPVSRDDVVTIIVEAFARYQAYASHAVPSDLVVEHHRAVGRIFSFLCATVGLADDDDDEDDYDPDDFGEDVPTGCTASEMDRCCVRVSLAGAKKTLGQLSCAICLEDYCKKRKLDMLHCKHVFHTDCVRTWLEKKRTCPLCKADVLVAPTPPPPPQEPSVRRSKRLRGEEP